MSYRDYPRRYRSTNTAVASLRDLDFGATEFYYVETSAPRLKRREITITDRREVEVIEREAGSYVSPFFGLTTKPAETTKKWSSERMTNVEEIYE